MYLTPNPLIFTSKLVEIDIWIVLRETMIFSSNSLLVLRMAPAEGDVFQLKKVKALLTL